MNDALNHLLDAPAWGVYTAVALLVFAEDALFFGFVIPGETAAVLGGVAASRGHVALGVMIITVVLAAIVGDSVGYEVGRRFGSRIIGSRPLTRHQKRLGDAQDLLARRGGAAVFLGRFVAFFRAVMPALAGAAHMRYRRFLGYNAAGGLCWGVTFVLVGFVAANSYARIEQAVGRGAAVAVALLVITALIIWRIRARRKAEREGPALTN
ncbi:MAG TPA: DedA family protein [Actinomycetes bacterium]|nr:DedA family protein [Actinomycetes bacterium]